ncbi:MAG: hypothetical protein R3E90_09300 [Marinicella sp.]|nr:hypothetical protein [Xanthomonadales bacterium]
MKKIKVIWLFLSLLTSKSLLATASVPSLNDCPDMIFIDGVQTNSDPSNGSGGAYPGALQRTINIDNTYYYYIPSSYQVEKPLPLMIVWHGAAGAGNANLAAINMRNFWQTAAEQHHFIVVAQAATGSNGGWIPTTDSSRLGAIISDMDGRYNIEKNRKYIWGFSAGGFVGHALALNNADYFAAYAVSGADLSYANNAGYTPASAARQLPVFISVGQSDSYYNSAQNDMTNFTNAGWIMDRNIWFDGFIGGHELLNDLPEKAWNKICISTLLD